MTVNEKIINVLESLNIPIKSDFYGGGEKEYITFNFAGDEAEFADDEPISLTTSVQIHYFLPAKKNYLPIKKKIRKLLFISGFTYPAVTVIVEDETRHIVFECEIEDDDELEE